MMVACRWWKQWMQVKMKITTKIRDGNGNDDDKDCNYGSDDGGDNDEDCNDGGDDVHK